jgi:propanol-preferring alcohol dehydrogenase
MNEQQGETAALEDWQDPCEAPASETSLEAIMTKMKAIQVSKANAPFEVVEREIPAPADRQVRIKVEACGMCHSDAFVRAGAFPGIVLPRIPGHELAGRVDAVGAHVTAWKPGDRVGVGWHGGHCFECGPCRRGLFLNCVKAKITGITHDGGYAEYVVVPTESVARIPAKLEAAAAGPLLCAGVTTYNSLRNSGARPGDTVAVQGIGGLGHLGIQYAAKMGFRTVAVSSGSDKEELARQLGAHEYVDTKKVSAGEGLKKLGGADLVLATAPHSAAIAATIEGLKPRGKLLLVAAPMEPLNISAMPLLSGKTIAGWPSGSALDSEETMEFSELQGVRARIETFPFEKVEEAFARLMANKVRFRVVLTP